MAIDQEKVTGLNVLQQLRPLICGKRPPWVLTLPAQVNGENGIPQALQVLC
jgi:hypothetical protein